MLEMMKILEGAVFQEHLTKINNHGNSILIDDFSAEFRNNLALEHTAITMRLIREMIIKINPKIKVTVNKNELN